VSRQQERARAIQREIGEILLYEWDPIGIQGCDECADEYHSYIGGVYRLLANDASPGKIASHLAQLERVSMGLSNTDPARLLPVAEKLARLKTQLSNT
jgi:hypothetical protein